MKILLQHPTGNANVRAAVMGLQEAGLLEGFHTAIATFPGSFLDRISDIGPFSELKRRRFDASLAPLTKMHPWHELGRMIAAKAGLSQLTKHEFGPLSIDAVYHHLDREVARVLNLKNGLSAVYAYEDGATCSFRQAKSLGISCLYDLPIGYWRAAQRLMEREKELWPEWAPTLTGIKNSAIKLARKDEELSLSDRIFVASRFTANTLKEFPGQLSTVEVIPYGFPVVSASRDYELNLEKRPLKLLFVGGLSQRKGIANLFEAVEPLKEQISLTVVGRKASEECPALDRALKKHHWIPSLPHAKVLQLMREHDVLVFPSLFEGFGLVITEAMSQGTPVITTDRTAGPDVINPGKNGWLVEAGSTIALRAAIAELLDHPEKIALAGDAAMQTAGNRPWSVYGSELAAAVKRHLS